MLSVYASYTRIVDICRHFVTALLVVKPIIISLSLLLVYVFFIRMLYYDCDNKRSIIVRFVCLIFFSLYIETCFFVHSISEKDYQCDSVIMKFPLNFFFSLVSNKEFFNITITYVGNDEDKIQCHC